MPTDWVSIINWNDSVRCSSSSVANVRLKVFHGIGTDVLMLLPVTSSEGRNIQLTCVIGPLCDSNLRKGCLLVTSHTIQFPSSDADINKLPSNDNANEVTVPLYNKHIYI